MRYTGDKKLEELRNLVYRYHISGQMVYSVRMQCGRVLAMESPVEADIVSSVPESGTAAAHGYARQVSARKLRAQRAKQECEDLRA